MPIKIQKKFKGRLVYSEPRDYSTIVFYRTKGKKMQKLLTSLYLVTSFNMPIVSIDTCYSKESHGIYSCIQMENGRL